MEYQKTITQYQSWLTHREYSPATIQKYTRALARFFADTGAGKRPTREAVAAWRDSLTAKGYTPSTVNAPSTRMPSPVLLEAVPFTLPPLTVRSPLSK